jgi:sialate O-acetylesterase
MNTTAKTLFAVALAAAMLFSPLAANAAKAKAKAKPAAKAAKEPAEKPKPAIELGAPFADNAILQREMDVPVWGWSKAGTKVTVEFAEQKEEAAADADGKWMLKLKPLKANDSPQEMVIADDAGNKIVLKNILVGEVWMASGQSNMQWEAGKASTSKIISELAAKGKLPPIREAKVTNACSSLQPIEHAEGAWSDGSSFSEYSAIAFAFAYDLYKELKIPIGIVNCAFSTTAIQAWTPREGFTGGTDDYTKKLYTEVLEGDPTTPQHKAAWDKYYQELEDTLKENAERMKNGQPAKAIPGKDTPGNLRGNRDACWMYNAKINPVVPYAIRGAIWNQGYANMGQGLAYYNNLHSLIRGWRKVWDKPELPVYFHQFYCPKGDADSLSLNSTAEMRLGTWLARDIPNADMASQIDVTGAVHYTNKAVPGQRLARLALKNQYGKDIVADGPMFKSYKVEGDKLIVDFDFAEGGLVVGETETSTSSKYKGPLAHGDPNVIANGDDKVTLFYIADKDRVWHKAKMMIDGAKVVLTAPGVSEPRGVAYACNGVASLPNLYNRAMLPMTAFIYYDHKLVTKAAWPDDPIKVAGVTPDPASGGLRNEYRKMPLLSTQFRDNAVFQAGVPVTFWGSAVHDWGYEAKGKAVIKFSFAGVEKTIPVTPGMREWRVTVPAMEASADPKTLKVVFEIDGQVAHEREYKNIVVGDVWYVAAPDRQKIAASKGDGVVRVMGRQAKRSTFSHPSRFSVSVSTNPEGNRYASEWNNADGGFAAALGQRIAAKTGKPVGIIYMDGDALELKQWISYEWLKQAPSLMDDYKQLAGVNPGNPYYDANVRRYIADWKKYWSESVPQMMATKRLMNGAAWGSYPTLAGSITTNAAEAYNVLVHSFGPGSFKGIVFLCGPSMCEKDQGANYGEQLSVLANCWKDWFACPDPYFFYTIPSKTLAAKITRPEQIKGKSTAFEIGQWPTANDKQFTGFIDMVVGEAYK